MDPNPAHAAEDLWVFAYGSLMWRPGFAFRRARRGAADRRASGALRLFVRPPRHAGAARPGARARSRRRLPRHRLPGGDGGARRDRRLSARARAGDLGLPRMRCARSGSRRVAERRVSALCYMVDRGHAAICRPPVARAAVASRAPGPWPVRRQPRLRDRDGGGAGSSSAFARPSCICWRSGSRERTKQCTYRGVG